MFVLLSFLTIFINMNEIMKETFGLKAGCDVLVYKEEEEPVFLEMDEEEVVFRLPVHNSMYIRVVEANPFHATTGMGSVPEWKLTFYITNSITIETEDSMFTLKAQRYHNRVEIVLPVDPGCTLKLTNVTEDN